ncbi:uncharacterized protein [Populus alba]|uniref:uncharacterized protein n=1 Tax=Populus alba TaxID=43335 RepID=UPI00158F570F|nr:uncharacterized protein LOC118060572 [Populus alba]
MAQILKILLTFVNHHSAAASTSTRDQQNHYYKVSYVLYWASNHQHQCPLQLLAGVSVGIFNVPLTETAIAGTVPVPVAAIIAGSACSSNHLIVSPSDL